MRFPELSDAGYIVHRQRLRETSLILHCLTREHGMVSLVARGVGGGKRSHHCVIEFTPLALSWAGRSNLPNLTRSEAISASIALVGERLLSALYLNELVMRFVARGDANEHAFNAYTNAIDRLATTAELEPALRCFEVALLDACGYAVVLDAAVDSLEPIDGDAIYYYVPELGPLSHAPVQRALPINGATLDCLAGRTSWAPSTAQSAKQLMRFILRHHLGGKELMSRKMWLNHKASSASAVE